ncbi:MAG: BhlA/UviB family holin-like peptide [Clostridia bacterium]|nr:BhlA/UviB family holin-like peptide [Clostridia bacterium]MDD4685754.1 BhlA/UviB family holin-like peptide [Clostridia bacterium]
MQELINIIISNGVFATLFVALLFYQLKDSSQREKKYIATIEKLSKHIDIIEDVKEDVSEIKNILIIKKSRKEQKSEV